MPADRGGLECECKTASHRGDAYLGFGCVCECVTPSKAGAAKRKPVFKGIVTFKAEEMT